MTDQPDRQDDGLLLRRLEAAQKDCMDQGQAAAAILLQDARVAIVRLSSRDAAEGAGRDEFLELARDMDRFANKHLGLTTDKGLCPTTPSCPKSREVAQKPLCASLASRLVKVALVGFVAFLCVSARCQDRSSFFTRADALNEPTRMPAPENIAVGESSVYRGLFQELWDWHCSERAASYPRLNPIVKIPFQEIGASRYRVYFAESPFYAPQLTGCFAVIVDADFKEASGSSYWGDRHSHCAAGERLDVVHPQIANIDFGRTSARNISAFDLMAVPQLAVVNLLNRPSEIGDGSGSEGGNSVRIENVSAVPEDDIQKVVRGATIFAILIGFAYLVLRRWL